MTDDTREPIPKRMPSNSIPTTEVQHRLLIFMTVAGLNVALVKRRLEWQIPFDHAAAIDMLEHVEIAHCSIISLHTSPPLDT